MTFFFHNRLNPLFEKKYSVHFQTSYLTKKKKQNIMKSFLKIQAKKNSRHESMIDLAVEKKMFDINFFFNNTLTNDLAKNGREKQK